LDCWTASLQNKTSSYRWPVIHHFIERHANVILGDKAQDQLSIHRTGRASAGPDGQADRVDSVKRISSEWAAIWAYTALCRYNRVSWVPRERASNRNLLHSLWRVHASVRGSDVGNAHNDFLDMVIRIYTPAFSYAFVTEMLGITILIGFAGFALYTNLNVKEKLSAKTNLKNSR
jgi:hypothetical protein